MMKSAVKHNRKSKVKLTLLILLVVSILVFGGCIGGMQPVGWSGVAIADGNLFTGSPEGRLVAVYADGSRQWSEPLKAPATGGGFGCAPSTGGGGGFGCPSGAPTGVAIYGTPVVANELAYIAGYNGRVYAFNSKSLQLRWTYPRDDYLRDDGGKPIPIVSGLVFAMNNIYFCDSTGKIYALDAATGDKKWESKPGGKIWSTPTIDGETIYAGSFDKKLYAINALTGKKIWEYKTGGAISGSPLVYDKMVYFGSFDRNLYAVDAATGSKKWEFQGKKWFWAKPVASDNTVYAGCLDGYVYLLNAQTGAKITELNLESPIASSPVLVNKRVFIATHAGKVYNLDTTSNTIKLIATIDANISAPLSATDKVVYIHTELTIHTIDIETGAKLMPISLKSG